MNFCNLEQFDVVEPTNTSTESRIRWDSYTVAVNGELTRSVLEDHFKELLGEEEVNKWKF